MNKNNYIPNPINTKDVALPKELNTLVEDIAKNVHEVWSARRMKDSWTYGEERNDAEKAELEGEDVKRDVFDESSVVSSAIDKVEKAMTPETKKPRPRREQPLCKSTDPLRTEHKWIEPEDCPEGAVYKGNEEKVSYVVMKTYIKAIH